MSTNTQPTPANIDEIDLRQYVDLLIDWRREILLTTFAVTLLAVIAVFGFRSFLPPPYAASVTIAIARVKSDVTLDERFRTLSDEDSTFQMTNAGSRRAALVGLVQNGAIAQIVIEELGDLLTADEQIPANLLEDIKAVIVAGQNSRVESDLIRITATADAPEKAAAIANAWGTQYVEQINAIYGQVPAEVATSVDEELTMAEGRYGIAQQNLEEFLATNQISQFQRLIDEKQTIIDTLQTGKQTAISTIVEEELNARRRVISAYITALSQNRLLGFTKEQEAKQAFIGAYIDAEIESRLKAIETDQEARQALFDHLADAQLASIITVFEQQVQDNVAQLDHLYDERSRIEGFVDRALVLQQQIAQGGDAAAETNSVGIMLLKSQIVNIPERQSMVMTEEYARRNELPALTMLDSQGLDPKLKAWLNEYLTTALDQTAPSFAPANGTSDNNIQFNFDISSSRSTSASDQLQDVTALVAALQSYAIRIEEDIQTLSEQLITGNSYQYLDQLTAIGLGVSSPLTDTAVAWAKDDIVQPVDGQNSSEIEPELAGLSAVIRQRYQALFEVGGLSELDPGEAVDSPLMAQINTLYPDLFTLGTLSQLTEDVPQDNPLALMSIEKAQELLQLQGLEDIPEYTTAAEPLIQAIDKLEREIQALEAKREAESSRSRQLIQQRDLTWDTYKTLSNKSTELNLAQSATNSEVRLAAPAVPPVEPIERISLLLTIVVAGVMGLALGIFGAFFANFMHQQPFFAARRSRSAS